MTTFVSERFDFSKRRGGRVAENSLSPARARSNRSTGAPIGSQAPDKSVEFEKFHVLCNCKLFATRYIALKRWIFQGLIMHARIEPTVITEPAGWRRDRGRPALAEVFGSIATRPTGSFWRKLVSFLGPGYLVAVGYMDPGNWATSLAGGSKFGYALLTVALLSNLMAILLQALCARLGIGVGP